MTVCNPMALWSDCSQPKCRIEGCQADPQNSAPRPAVNVMLEATMLVAEARRQGLVLTVEQRPLTPLAMGHHDTHVSVRPARGGV